MSKIQTLSECREQLHNIKNKIAAEKYIALSNKDLVDTNYFLGQMDAINKIEKYIESFGRPRFENEDFG